MKSTEIVGSSTAMPGSRSGASTDGERLADLDASRSRTSATMSPAPATSTSTRCSPSKV